MAKAIKTVGVIGTGVIGASWTGLFLSKGLKVIVSDPAEGAEGRLREYLEGIWPTVEKLGLGSGANINNYKFVGKSLKDHGGELDFIQENGPERTNIKESIIDELEGSLRSDVIIASSSSGIPSSKFTTKCKHPERVLIGHPFNPPHLMPLVEVVPHPGTASDVTKRTLNFYTSLGKKPVLLRQETPGFAANRLQAALCNEAYSLVNRGVMSAEDVDTCMTASLGPRWAVIGPFMSNVFGGGGGAGGFKHILAEIGSTSLIWTNDMKAHEFVQNEAGIDNLDKSVQEMLKKHPIDQVKKERDEMLVDILKKKKDMKALI